MLLPLLAIALAADTIYEFSAKDINGKEVALNSYSGRVLLVVNVASRCGLTPQYEALESLYQEHKEAGLVVLGFPANDFNGQEPGTDEEIKAFCTTNYGVTFPMFSKIVVTGDNKSELFRWLIAESGSDEEIEWNFAKFVVGRKGNVVERFHPKVAPNDPSILKVLRAELAKK